MQTKFNPMNVATPIIQGLNGPKVPPELVGFFERERGPIVKGFVEREFRQNERDAQELGKTDEERAAIKRRLDRALLKEMAELVRQHDQAEGVTQATNQETKTVTVCDACFQASCWQGIFLCNDARTAGTVEKTIEELKALNTGEHPSYWQDEE